MKHQETPLYFIIENVIYRCIKHNEQAHYILEVSKQPTKQNFKKIEWELYWNLDRLTLEEAIELIMKSPSTVYNKRYYKKQEENKNYPDGVTLGERYRADMKVRRMNWALSA